MRLVLISLVLSISGQIELLAQTDPQNMVGVFISNPVNGTIIDNRSQFQRQSNYHSYRAYGTSTWSVDMQWADGTPSSWTSYGSTAQVNQASPPSGIGFGLDPTAASGKPYHDFIRFVTTGTVTIQGYFGTKNAWWLNTVGTVSFPITAAQGGTTGLFIVDQLYSTVGAACTAAAAATATLILTKAWTGMTSQTLGCNIQAYNGGSLQPASGQTVTISGSITAPLVQIFDLSLGGSVAITGRIAQFYTEWWGADRTGSIDSTAAIQATLTAAAANVTGQSVPVQFLTGTYLCGSITWPTGVDLIGQGPDLGTTLRFNGTDNTVWFSRSINASTFVVRGFTFDVVSTASEPSNIFNVATTAFEDFNGRFEHNEFSHSKGDALSLNGAWASFYIENNRWDEVGGYAIRMTIPLNVGQSFSTLTIRNFYFDNAFQSTSPGFLAVDNSVNSYSFPTVIHIVDGRWELNSALAAPYALVNLIGSMSVSNWTSVDIHNAVVSNNVMGTPTSYLLGNSNGSGSNDNSFSISNLDQTGLTGILTGTWARTVPLQGHYQYVQHGGYGNAFILLDPIGGAPPSCTTGTGVDGTGGAACSASAGGGAFGTPYAGYFSFTTSGSPAANATLVTLGNAAGVFTRPPVCVITPGYFSALGSQVSVVPVSPNTATSTAIVIGPALTTATFYRFNYVCPFGQ